MIRSHARSILGVAAVGAAALKFVATATAAGMIWIHLCGSYTQGSGSTGGTLGVARSWTSNPGVATPFGCPPNSAGTNPYGMEVFGGRSSVPAGARAHWEIDAPGGLVIVGVHTEGSGMVSYGVNQNMGWGGGFYWQGGGAQAYPAEVGYSSPPLFSSYFGWQIICGWSTCNGGTKPGEISILGLEIEAAEGSGPTVAVAPASLGAASGWVRGVWTIAFSADGPSGACQLSASLGGANVSQPLNEPQSQITWHQCPAGSFSQSFNTAAVASGAGVPLVMWARDAAYDYSAGHYLSSAVTSNVNIDNDPVGVTSVGPDGRAVDGGHAVRDGDRLGWTVRCVRHRVLGRRVSVSVVSAGERAGAGGRGGSSQGHVLRRQQLPGTRRGMSRRQRRSRGR